MLGASDLVKSPPPVSYLIQSLFKIVCDFLAEIKFTIKMTGIQSSYVFILEWSKKKTTLSVS